MIPFLIWFVYLIANLAVTVVAYIITPILPAFANKNGWLPNWLDWFQTQDNSLDGDGGWKNDHYPGMSQYKKRMLWLWRNSAYGFKQNVLAHQARAEDHVVAYGDNQVSNLDGHGGWTLRLLQDRNMKTAAWQFYLVVPYPHKNRCFRLNLGWKLWDFNDTDRKISYVSSIGFWNQFG